MSEEKRKLSINCGLALLFNDRDGMLDNYDSISINSGKIIVSSAVNAKLNKTGAAINTGDLLVRDIKGEVLQLDKGAVIDKGAGLKDLFVITHGDIIVTKEGVKELNEAESLISLGKIYHPESENISSMANITGEKRAYPDGAFVILGNHDLGKIITNNDTSNKHFWISGRLTAFDKKALEDANALGLSFGCDSFFSYEGLNKEFESMIKSTNRILVPDGYEITGKINGSELPLYGKKIYVDGKFTMEEKDLPALEKIEAIIVKGKASLPSSAAEVFRSKGKADSYFIFEGRYIEINGFEQFSHGGLDAINKKGEKITIQVNGCLLFDKDVTPEDMDCIASVSYNGTIIIPGAAKSTLAAKVKTGNGFMGDPDTMRELTGQSIQDMIWGALKEGEQKNSKDTNINMGTYILV